MLGLRRAHLLVVMISILLSASTLGDDGDSSSYQEQRALLPVHERGYFGLSARYEDTHGLYGQMRIVEIHPNGPAEKAELQVGDLVTAVNNVRFRFVNDLDMIRQFGWVAAGETIELRVNRGNEIFTVPLKTTQMPPQRLQALIHWLAEAERWYEEGGQAACREQEASLRSSRVIDSWLDTGEIVVAVNRSSAGKTVFKVEGRVSDGLIHFSKMPLFQSIGKTVKRGEARRFRLRKDERGIVRVEPLDGSPIQTPVKD